MATQMIGTFPCYSFSVKVIQARHISSRDLWSFSDCYVSLWLPSVSNKQVVTKTIPDTPNPVWNESFHFVIQTQSKNMLELKLYDQDVVTKDDLLFTVTYDIAKGPESLEVEFKMESTCCGLEQIITNGILMSNFFEGKMFGDNSACSGVLLKTLPLDVETNVALPLTESAELELQLRVKDCLGDLDVRLECDLCGAEQDFLYKRQKVVARALEKLLGQKLQSHEVPVIAVMATGGGARAMSALYGHLSALQKLNLLDCITYLSGASGSTWTMRSLYEEPDWSQKDLIGPIRKAQECILTSKSNAFSMEALQCYNEELRRRTQEGHSISFTDVWSLIIDHMFHDEQSDSKLSDQQQAVNQGQNPLPIYVALTVKEDTQTTSEFKEWCEFSPYEVGFSKYGAFIRSEHFGSEFYMGRLMKKKPESRICYLEGIWSNIFSLNLVDVWNLYKLMGMSFIISTPRNICLADSHLDHHPNYLTPLEKELCLVDAGYFINTSCPPLLRKERNVDVIISLDYNLLETRFNSLEQMSKYCLDQEIPFPKIVLTEEDKKNPKECYLFEDKENPVAPIVLHFPLVNDSFREYKKPGINRTAAEMTQGEVELNSLLSPYKMTDLTYTEDEFNKLLNLCDYNIQNNRLLILQALWTATERRNVSRL
ncbi:hypothetical protein JD844_021290 [Phrynosoma platyrhinos]|uniref:Phospholipase A2 n=1 Tax=Phrynosoma platyrhinos TaxID=52577 RepID=A0ABQ7STI1_PHRPL|nr:hypothetical protein JD844_021290 [Phrynosoma platyrhinos]